VKQPRTMAQTGFRNVEPSHGSDAVHDTEMSLLRFAMYYRLRGGKAKFALATVDKYFRPPGPDTHRNSPVSLFSISSLGRNCFPTPGSYADTARSGARRLSFLIMTARAMRTIATRASSRPEPLVRATAGSRAPKSLLYFG
jgi:hypothetical protein